MSSSKRKKKLDPNSNVAIGRSYEKVAARFFTENGYTICDQNWQAGNREIDIIVRKGDLVAFVEVKSSANLKFGHPAERVDKRKIANLTKAAQQYLIEKEITDCDIRFDVITFLNGQIEHYPNAFEAAD